MKRQAPEWEKMFAKHISSHRLVSQIHKESSKLNSENQFNLKMSKRQTFYLRG